MPCITESISLQKPEHTIQVYTIININSILCLHHQSFVYRLLQQLDAFIKAIPGKLGPSIGVLLCEIFSGGPSITLSVKEDQIWRMVCKLFAKGKEAHCQTNSALMSALTELIQV